MSQADFSLSGDSYYVHWRDAIYKAVHRVLLDEDFKVINARYLVVDRDDSVSGQFTIKPGGATETLYDNGTDKFILVCTKRGLVVVSRVRGARAMGCFMEMCVIH